MKVEVSKLRKEFLTTTGPLVVLDHLDLVLEAGDALAITGPSGCGKSTLLHILGTLDQATQGQVLFDGRDVNSLSDGDLAKFRNESIGFVFQDHFLLPQCSVLENLLVPTLVAASSAGTEERALHLLDQVGLADRATHQPAALSGGERQRAAIARSLIHAPGLLLCDEPTGNLDTANAERIADLLLQLQSEAECTLVVVTHSAELAARFPRQLALRAGSSAHGDGSSARGDGSSARGDGGGPNK